MQAGLASIRCPAHRCKMTLEICAQPIDNKKKSHLILVDLESV